MSEDEKKKTWYLPKQRALQVFSLVCAQVLWPLASSPLFYPALRVTFPVLVSLVSALQPSPSLELGSIRQIFNLGGFYFNF